MRRLVDRERLPRFMRELEVRLKDNFGFWILDSAKSKIQNPKSKMEVR